MSVNMKFDPAKFSRNASAAASDYEKGAMNPKRSPTAGAIASKDAMLAGIQNAVSSGRWQKRLEASGDAAYTQGIKDKGRARYQTGVATQSAVGKVTAHLQSMQNVLSGVTLAPRGPKGSNYGNVQTVGDALRKGFGKVA
jgi:hypothetical protein